MITDLHRTPIVGQPRTSNRFPASFAQQRLWFLDQMVPNNPFYNFSEFVRFHIPLNTPVLERSINEIVRRHEALRTIFVAEDGQPMQVIIPSLTVALPVIDLRRLPPAEREVEAQRLATEEARRPFDLKTGPLLRTTLLQLDTADYIFLLTLHHIVSDAWSMTVLSRELSAIYPAFVMGQPSPLQDLVVQYVDFAVWQRERLQGSVLEEHMAYWRHQLANAPILEVSTDRPRPPMPTFQGGLQNLTIPQRLVEGLRRISRERGVTLYMTLLAAFSTLLYRYTGQDDIVLGAPITGRNRRDLEHLIGFFVNTLVLRIDLSGNPTFEDLLDRVREVTLDAYAHQDIPFEKLVQELQPKRDLSRNPLCQIAFQLLNNPHPAQSDSGGATSTLEIKRGTTVFDMVVTLGERVSEVGGHVEYSSDLFDPDTISRLVEHYLTLLGGIVADPSRRLSDLPLLTDRERRQVLVDWNTTKGDSLSGLCLHQAVEDYAHHSPDAVAAKFGQVSLTYAELNRRANQLARYLCHLGLEQESPVGLCVERSLEMVVGVLGILKAGCAFVPLDPAYPLQRLDFMLKDAGVQVLLTQAGLVKRLLSGISVLCLDSEWPLVEQQDGGDLDTTTGGENLAYVIYTSGSTGQPKGVMVEHRGLSNVAQAQAQLFGVGPDSRVLQFASSSFDASVFEMAMAFAHGATLCLAPKEMLLPGPPLIELMNEEQVSIVTLPSSALVVSPYDPLPALQTMTVAGEACPQEVVARWALGRKFFNLYGPTEASIWTTYAQCENGRDRPPIGRPIENVKVYILDRHMNPVPIGVPGELHIGGIGLARGYLHRPGLTAEKFIPNPFGDRSGERLYKTGDLVRYLPDGSLDYLGRLDQQVKLRGYRIELGEIEAVLMQHPLVQQAVVDMRDRVSTQACLIAYVTPSSENIPAAPELSAYLREQLPEYMIPAVFVNLDSLPLTPSGKIDRHALPIPSNMARVVDAPFVAPGNVLQLAIAEIWQEVLGVDKVGLHDNFFDLGGHSLLMTRVHARAAEIFGQDISMIDLFKYPTIHALALYLEKEQTQAPPIEQIRNRAEKQKEAMRRRRERMRER